MSRQALDSFVAGELQRVVRLVEELPVERIEAVGETLVGAYRHDGHVFLAGNGGSAATASHFACDLANTVPRGRRRFRVTSLNDNVPLLTAAANDRGYERVFADQLADLIQPEDVLVAISGSGRSPNVLEAIRTASDRSATVVALLGYDGGDAADFADACILVPSDDYGLIEDVHTILHHLLTAYVARRLAGEE